MPVRIYVGDECQQSTSVILLVFFTSGQQQSRIGLVRTIVARRHAISCSCWSLTSSTYWMVPTISFFVAYIGLLFRFLQRHQEPPSNMSFHLKQPNFFSKTCLFSFCVTFDKGLSCKRELGVLCPSELRRASYRLCSSQVPDFCQ